MLVLTRSRSAPLAAWAVWLSVGIPTLGLCETNPYSLGPSIAVNHDSNVFRTTDDPISDTTRTIGLVGGFDQPIGRERLYANASLGFDRHVRLTQLDDTSYALTTGLEWSSANRLSGSLRYDTSRSLAGYGIADAPRTQEKNLQRSQQLSSSVRYGLHSQLSLELSGEHRSLGYSADIYKPFEYRQDTAGLGVHIGSAGHLTFAVGVRATRGTTPNFEISDGVFQADKLRRSDSDFSATWTETRLNVTTRVSYSRETHTQPTYPGFSGPTGAIDLNYETSSRTRLTIGARRDTGSATTFFNFAPTLSPIRIDSSRFSTETHASFNYSVTSKVSVAVRALYNRGDTADLFGETRDTTSSYSLSADYDPYAFMKLSCSADRELRQSSIPGVPSHATIVGCSLAGTIR